ncbi:MAG TPA: glycoside hydrolase family 9 protein [Verrucomicrobiae bacterium]|nr:glycoside hydrolase family 9 protein [Verrucomicrobiae bacterium]
MNKIHFSYIRLIATAFLATFQTVAATADELGFDSAAYLPPVGEAQLRIIKPDLLELSLVTTKAPAPARPTQWNFVAGNFQYALPAAAKFLVRANGAQIGVKSIGFKRRPLYADFAKRDLRILNELYVELNSPITDGAAVTVTNPDGTLWSPTNVVYSAELSQTRFSPAIHVNQNGYMPGFSKKAMIGFYLGTMGELTIPSLSFRIVDSGLNTVFEGNLSSRGDTGYTFSPAPYQKVYQADFTSFNTPGEYRLVVPGLGASHRFRIDDGVAAAYARAYGLGLYHQRCGTNNVLPYTRHVHDPCHTAKAEVPTDAFTAVNKALADFSANYTNNARHTARRLDKVSASLYPFINTARVDVTGGHHDAGDYSKYTINSAQLIHHLVFAVDTFPGVKDIDNLGLPESGDGIPDLLHEAKWEADFLAKMQDADGGFYFLVYPRNRQYEDNVLPDRGDSQVVFPKTTAATAAAVAALAQIASSPQFKSRFPVESSQYLAKAVAGWGFLERAIATYGRDGSYQKINHYGDEFMHDDELAWAATELFFATGDYKFQNELIARFDPSNRSNLAQGWMRMWEGYGATIRSYAFAPRNGRIAAGALNAFFLAKCELELAGAAEEQARFSNQTAYGCSLPDPYKLSRNASWYFAISGACDLPCAALISNPKDYTDTLLLNMNYEGGCNPLNVSYITGLGFKRQRQMTHQYAQNDRRALPPSGLPLGSVQRGFQSDLPLYPNSELANLTFPHDYASDSPHLPYDIWGDAYNVINEFTIPVQARALGAVASLMARTPLKDQPWNGAEASISLTSTNVQLGQSARATLDSSLNVGSSQVIWEARNTEPVASPDLLITPRFVGRSWIEAEAVSPDGRRIFATTELNVSPVAPTIQVMPPFTLRIGATIGQSFTIQGAFDFGDWEPVYTGVLSTPSFDWTDENSSELGYRFFRVVTGL